MAEWKDVTTYPRGAEKVPTCWSVGGSKFRVVVTCGHIRYPGKWVMHCYKLGIDTRPLLTAKTKEQAQEQALNTCKNVLLEIQQHLAEIEED